MDFLREFDEHLWVSFGELLAVTGSLLGVLGVVPGASRSGQILSVRRPSVQSVRPSCFFLEPILEQQNGILVEKTREKISKKVIFERNN